MDKKRILLLDAMGILLAAAIALGAVWIMEAAEYAGYKADYVDIAEDVLHSDEDDGMIELVPLSPAPKQNDTLDDPTASAATDPRSTAEPSRPASASNADGKEAAQRVSVDFAALAAQNSDTVGWLYIPGTKINYPVVQADDNEYYLSRSFKQEEASCGTIFMDYQNDLNPLDRNTILFGHNMGSSSSLMFSQLTKFKKAELLGKTSDLSVRYARSNRDMAGACCLSFGCKHAGAVQLSPAGLPIGRFVSRLCTIP